MANVIELEAAPVFVSLTRTDAVPGLTSSVAGTFAYNIPLVSYEVDSSVPFQNTAVVGVNPLPFAIFMNPGFPAGTGLPNAVKVSGPKGGELCEIGATEPEPHPSADTAKDKARRRRFPFQIVRCKEAGTFMIHPCYRPGVPVARCP
jgi:hypothetical protein